MSKTQLFTRPNLWEALFQFLLLGMVFIFYAFDRSHGQVKPVIEASEVAFFLNYAAAAFLINYFLLPRFLYRRKYLHFTLYIIVLIGLVIFIEEGIIEQIYYPDTRGAHFPGIFFNLASALPPITILSGFKFAWDALTKQNELEQLKVAAKESELQYLKSQINPHFLFNNLNNLYAYALENSPKTPEIILELSSVLRYMLYECQEQYVPLYKEIEQLTSFVELSRLQAEGRGTIDFKIKNLQEESQIAPLILSVFIENAFKHSLSSQNEDIRIGIEVQMNENGQLHFTCENTYFEQSNTSDLSKGIGLKNVKKRLELLYPEGHHLEIISDKKTYKVNLMLDLFKTSSL